MKKVLIISPVPFFPVTAGNRSRILNLIDNIKELNYEVHFFYVDFEQGDLRSMKKYVLDNFYYLKCERSNGWYTIVKKVIRRLFLQINLTLPYYIDEWYNEKIDKEIEKIKKKHNFDYVITEYVFMSKVFERFEDNVIKILDTHDIFADRDKIYKKNGEKPAWFYTSSKQETKGFNRSDVIIAIQDYEKSIIQNKVQKKVITVGHTLNINKYKEVNDNNILFLGSNNIINIEAIKAFIKEVLPEIKKAIKDVNLLIAGSVCDSLEKSDQYTLIGKVDCLDDIYNISKVVINPLIYGTGLKIKSIEALSYSKPLVTTIVGAEGLDSDNNNNFIVIKDNNEFALEVIKLLSNKEYSRRIGENASFYVEYYNNSIKKNLEEIFEEN